MPPRQPSPSGGQRPPLTPPSGGKSTESAFVDIAIAVIVFLVALTLLRSFFTSAFGGYVNVLAWFYTKNWRLWYIIITIVISLINAVLLFFMFWIIKRFNKLHEKIPQEETTNRVISQEEDFQQNWQEIRLLIDSGSPSDWNMAILRADAQLDTTLDHLGYDGETIAERLKIVDPTKLKSMDRVWSAHRLRNTIAHDPLQQYTREMMMHAFESYEVAFKELGILREVK